MPILLICILLIGVNNKAVQPTPESMGYNNTDYYIFMSRLTGAYDLRGSRIIIPVFPSMMAVDDNGFIELDTDKPIIGEWSVYCDNRTFTIAERFTGNYDSIRCTQFQGRVDTKGYGEPFYISTKNMEQLFLWGARLEY